MTEPFTTLSGPAAPMPEENIDTDIIFPARFLLITAKAGLGGYAFHDRRYDANGVPLPDYVLNKAPFHSAPFIVAGANFGSGSSREQAVWAIAGLGVRCIIAPGFGEIFNANCQRNGVLPITLPADKVEELMASAQAGQTFSVDLEAQTLTVGNRHLSFDIAPERKLALLNGWDETAVLLHQFAGDIAEFETRQKASAPWLYAKDDAS
ncbi:3-isopropylmalate dehydratase small subunit [Novosphingobium sp.]|uniref:3-isopropylmalate dehydratase small subunit n=1 Tax=Novosphingobium sp. TaxID=1874826 RepID=UPI0031D9ED68